MAITYAQLVDAVQDTTENYEATFVANIPGFVRQAEQRVYASGYHPVTRQRIEDACTVGSPYIYTPPGFLTMYSVLIGQAGIMEYALQKDVSFIREAFPNVALGGQPKYYAMLDTDTVLLGPVPDAIYDVEMHYLGYPESIVDTGTSWLGDNFEHVLQYGALLNAYVFMKGEEDVLKMYQERYESALGQMKNIAKLGQSDEYRAGTR